MTRPNWADAIKEPTKIDIQGKTAAPTFIERQFSRPLTPDEVAGIIIGKTKIYVFGVVAFVDDFGIQIEAGFCWEYFGLGADDPRVGHIIPGGAAKPCEG